MAQRVAVVGVGRMGANMARRLKNCNIEIAAVYDAVPAVADALAEELGSNAPRSLADVTKAADAIITVVSDDAAMREIYFRADDNLLMLLGCAACFSADDDGVPVLPFDPRTGQLRPDVWDRWLAWDPVRMVDRYADALRSLRAVWIDAGTRDEWFLDIGAQAFRDGLRALGLPDDRVAFELFDAAHGGIEYRYPLALRWLASRIGG